MALEDIRRDRVKKLEHYESSGFEAYPSSVRRTFLIGETAEKFSGLAKGRKKIFVVGRIRAWREHGSATFADLNDASGTIQLFFSKDELGQSYDLLGSAVDIGDFLEAGGTAFKTKRGEPTLKVSEWRIISKAILPLPEKWHGLQEAEERFRKRYLDLVMNKEVRERFLLRYELIGAIRGLFNAESFIEVETPILQPLAGGALARPFETRHNALGLDLYLRVAPELYLKELLIGGMEKVYELGKSFRNEGIDATHNPEFTTIEWYAAYWDEEIMMVFVEKIFLKLAKQFSKRGITEYQGKKIAWKKNFPRISFADVLKRYALITDYNAAAKEDLILKAKQFGIEVQGRESKASIADEIYKKICRPHLVNPIFIVNHPVEISPLAKKISPGAATVRRLQLIAGGLELVNAYAELNDPRDQRSRFDEQAKIKAGGEEESHPFDEGFVEALEYGMPPAAGAAIGIDRLAMLFTDVKNIKEVILFPTMRPR